MRKADNRSPLEYVADYFNRYEFVGIMLPCFVVAILIHFIAEPTAIAKISSLFFMTLAPFLMMFLSSHIICSAKEIELRKRRLWS